MGIQWMQAIPHEGTGEQYPVPEKFVFSSSVRFGESGWAGLCVGMDGKNGYALLANVQRQEAHFLELKNNAVWLDRGMRRRPLAAGKKYGLRAEYDSRVLRAYLLEENAGADPWPLFEFPLELHGYAALCPGGGATFGEAAVSPLENPFYTGETFTNPVMVGADPDILLHEGRYYLYNRVPNDPSSSEDAYLYNGSDRADLDRAGDKNAIFRVSSSTDLVHWSPYKTVFSRDSVLEGAFCMSPNVTYQNGWFYLFFAGGRFKGDENFHIYCASSRSPEGPFTLKSTAPLHADTEEIGGMPFIDDDGQVYLSLVRFDRGNHIWLQKACLRDGVAEADREEPAKPILSPREDYEVDEYGRIVEGAVFIRHKGLYYMIYADGSYLGHYGESCAVAENIFGPYRRQKNNPILHHHFMADGTGDGIVIYNRDKSEMYIGYHRHVSAKDVEPRMTCIDRMRFEPDPEGGPDLLTVYGPTVTPQPIPFTK